MTGWRRTGLVAAVALLASGVLWSVLWPPGPSDEQTSAGPGIEQNFDVVGFISSFGDAPQDAMSGPWDLVLPRDYGAHPEAGAETWSIAAHLQDPSGRPVAVNIVMTRLGYADRAEAEINPWRVGPVFLGQAIATSPSQELRGTTTRASRAARAAGFEVATRQVWLDDWTLTYDETGLEMTLRLDGTPLSISLEASKPPLALDGQETPGTRGFAISRLAAVGRLGTGADAIPLAGAAWLDRLWGEIPLPGGPLVRDRLVLHLSDGTDLSLLRTRRRDGRGIATLDAVLVTPDGDVTFAGDETIVFGPEPPEGNAAAPSVWRITGEGLDLRATVLDAQTRDAFALPGWVGQLAVEGTRNGATVTGAGTLLLSGEGGT